MKEDIRNTARFTATTLFPTENGFFDARGRWDTFYKTCLDYGLIVSLGYTPDEELEQELAKHRLDF